MSLNENSSFCELKYRSVFLETAQKIPGRASKNSRICGVMKSSINSSCRPLTVYFLEKSGWVGKDSDFEPNSFPSP